MTNSIFILITTGETLDPDIMKAFMSLISIERQRSIMRYRRDIDKKMSLYSELLLRLMLQIHLRIDSNEIAFKKNTHGKPYLQNHPGIFYNFSHSHNGIALGLSGKELGVDIEKIRKAPLDIVPRFFTENEAAYIFQSANENERSERFFRIWTKKEAFAKRNGLGLSQEIRSIKVLDAEVSGSLFSNNIGNYIYSVCSELNETSFSKKHLSEKEFSALLFQNL